MRGDKTGSMESSFENLQQQRQRVTMAWVKMTALKMERDLYLKSG